MIARMEREVGRIMALVKELGGKPVAEERIAFAGQPLDQIGFVWSPIDSLLTATAPTAEG